MKAEDAADMMDQDKQTDRFKQRAAVSIAILAMLLAITGLGGANAGKEATNNNIYAANQYAFYQAKNMRQTDYKLAADAIELAFLKDGSLNAEAKAALKAKPRTIARRRRATSRARDAGGQEGTDRAGQGLREQARPCAEAGSVLRLCRSAAADRHRADLGLDRRDAALACDLRRHPRCRGWPADGQRLYTGDRDTVSGNIVVRTLAAPVGWSAVWQGRGEHQTEAASVDGYSHFANVTCWRGQTKPASLSMSVDRG